jgi:hypothetical protein
MVKGHGSSLIIPRDGYLPPKEGVRQLAHRLKDDDLIGRVIDPELGAGARTYLECPSLSGFENDKNTDDCPASTQLKTRKILAS